MTTVLLHGGVVVDGTGQVAPYRADVLLRGTTIEAITSARASEPEPLEAYDKVLDCSGTFVTPGFIDIHTHSDLTWLRYPESASRVTQGITTEVTGNCGMSPAPRDPADADFRTTISVIDEDPDAEFAWASFDQYLSVTKEHHAATNIAPLVGHGSIRQMILARSGGDPGVASGASAVAEIEWVTAQCLDSGAWGLSFGLMYAPGEAASRAELLASAKQAQLQGALLSVHMRNYEAANIEKAISEMLAIQAKTDVNLELSHLRVLRADGADVAERCLALLDSAGPGVHADAYPYTAGQTTLFQLLAPIDRRKGVAAMLSQLPERRSHYATSIASPGYSPEGILIVRTTSARDAGAVGMSLAELAHREQLPWSELAIDLLQRSGGYVDVVAFGSQMVEQEMILSHPKVMIGSDGWIVPFEHPAAIHPRAFGAFPKALRLLVDGGIPWEVAIAKATSLPATKIGLKGRGVLKSGAVGDITVFEPENLLDLSTYAAPFAASRGVRHVLVAAEAVIEDGVTTAARGQGGSWFARRNRWSRSVSAVPAER